MILRHANRVIVGATLFVGTVAAVAAFAAETSDKSSMQGTDERAAAQRLSGPSGPASVGNPVLAIPLSRLSNTRDRPIFSPSRRPPPHPAPVAIVRPVTPQIEPERPPFRLLGTVVGKSDGIAVVIEQATGAIVNLHTDESRQGWILRSVHGREVTLQRGGESSVLAMAPPGSGLDVATAQAYLQPTRTPRR
jgi:hypothetical protein